MWPRSRSSRRSNSHLLKALLISEELQVLVELKTVLLKEAIEGRLHVSELSVKPKQTGRCRFSVCHKCIQGFFYMFSHYSKEMTSALSPSPSSRPIGHHLPSLRSPGLREDDDPPLTQT